MTLNSKVQVEMPKKGVSVRHIGNSLPVYKTIRSYRNKHGTPTNEKVTIGKQDPETGKLIPNERYWDYYGRSATDRFIPAFELVRRIGGAFLSGSVLKRLGISEILDQCFGAERAGLITTAALYMAAKGNVFDGVDDYSSTCILNEAPLESQMSSKLFSSITHGERMKFFKLWVERQDPGGYLAYDVTSFSTYAKNIIDAEYGYNRDGDRLPQINLGCFVSQGTGLPVFYVTYPGSIVDKSHLPYMMAYNEELGIGETGFVLDRGFCSTVNVQHLEKGGHKFVIGVEKWHKATRAAIELAKPNIIKLQNRVESGLFAVSSKGCYYGITSTMHIYHDSSLAKDQMDVLCKSLDNDEDFLRQKTRLTCEEIRKYSKYFVIETDEDGSFTFKRNMDKIEQAASNCGFFCILENTSLDSSQTLAIYRRKDVIEKGFDDVKNYVSMKRLRTHTTETTDGKLFCSFLALIIVSDMGIRLEELMKQKSLSKAGVFREMQKITIGIDNTGWRLLNPITKTQRLIMQPLELKEEDLRYYITAGT